MESPLGPAHESRDARFQEYSGWRLPASYGDPARERDEVRAACGIIDLAGRGLIRFSGRDRQAFLQGMVSNDTRQLEPGAGLYATILEPKGHMVGDLTLYAFADFYLADVEPGTAAAVSRHLDRFVIREKVTIAAEDSAFTQIGISGPAARSILAAVLPSVPAIVGPYGCAAVEWEGQGLFVMRRDFTGEEGYQLAAPPGAALRLWEALSTAAARPFGQEALEILRVEGGIPRFGVDTGPEVIPLEARLFHGINRDKGCYVGQEIIERISSRGHTNRRLVPLKVAAGLVPAAGTPLRLAGRDVGRITSAVLSPSLGCPVALGYVRHEASVPTTALQLTIGEVETAAETLARPPFGSGEPPAIVNGEDPW